MRRLLALTSCLLTLVFVSPTFAETPVPAKPSTPAATGLITVATVDPVPATATMLRRMGCDAGVCLTAAPIDAIAKGDPRLHLFAGKVEGGWAPYFVKDQTALTIESASIIKLTTGEHSIRVVLDKASVQTFAALTARLVGQRLAIIVGDRVVSAPKVMERITGGTLQVHVGMASDAADLLKGILGK
ncbi:MAG: hypothetical protein ACI9U2_002266 [Bradymonadia bacterium]|jgi:hypothetical protein